MKELLKKRLEVKKRNGKKGFTLIEVIVVLVILAILAAIAIPALTGYIDKANQRATISEAAIARTSIQAIASDGYAIGGKLNNNVASAAAYSGATKLVASHAPASPASDTIYGYNPVSTKSSPTVADEVTALTGRTFTDSEITNIIYENGVVIYYTVEVNGMFVTFNRTDYTVSTTAPALPTLPIAAPTP